MTTKFVFLLMANDLVIAALAVVLLHLGGGR